MSGDSLFPTFSSHCFFAGCLHVETAASPEDLHEVMERHYAERHEAEIRRLLSDPLVKPYRPRRAGPEREWQWIITEALTREGYLWQYVYPMQTKDGGWRTSTTAAGFPDVTAWRPPWSIAMEQKVHGPRTAAGTPTPEQIRWLMTFAELPYGRAWVLRPTDDWQQIANWIHRPDTAPRIHGWVPPRRLQVVEHPPLTLTP